MKNPCKELDNTFWVKDGIQYELCLGAVFWRLVSFSGQTVNETITTPLTKNCPKPITITNWLEKNGYKRK